MKKFYDRHELAFAIALIVLYINVLSIADSVSGLLGTEKLLTFPAALLLSLFLFFWLRRWDMLEKYGLCAQKRPARELLWYTPLILLVSCNAWFGFRMNTSVPEAALYVLSMLCVGFLEELIFRGFLFKALCRDSVKSAVIISSITFGIGHIINMFNGSGMTLAANLCQVCCAISAGFMFVSVFRFSGSLIPCIAAHGALNALSAFAPEPGIWGQAASALAMCLISLGYAIYLNKKLQVPD